MENSPRPESPRERAVRALISRGLNTVNRCYGPDSPNPKPYHGPEHTLMVVTSAGLLADAAVAAGKITHDQHDALMIAAAYHDAVHEDDQDSEELSAELAVRHMNLVLGILSQTDINQVKRAIAATRVKAVANHRIEQSASPDDYLTMLMADADLSSFGLPKAQYWDTARRFFAETNPGIELAGQALQAFIRHQIKRITHHKYMTEEGRHLFHCQQENVEFLKSLYSSL